MLVFYEEPEGIFFIAFTNSFKFLVHTCITNLQLQEYLILMCLDVTCRVSAEGDYYKGPFLTNISLGLLSFKAVRGLLYGYFLLTSDVYLWGTELT